MPTSNEFQFFHQVLPHFWLKYFINKWPLIISAGGQTGQAGIYLIRRWRQ